MSEFLVGSDDNEWRDCAQRRIRTGFGVDIWACALVVELSAIVGGVMRISPCTRVFRGTVAAVVVRIALVARFAHTLYTVVVHETVGVGGARLGSTFKNLSAVWSSCIGWAVASKLY